MSKFTWITTLLSVVLVLNLVVLYYLNFQLREEINKVKVSSQSTVSQENAEPLQIVNRPTPDPEAIAFYSDSCNPACQTQINSVKQVITRITPQAIGSIETARSSVSNSAAKEYSVTLGKGSSDAKDWEDVPGVNAYINTDNYSDISSVIFEVSLRIPTANDEVFARLYNKTDSVTVSSSEVTTDNKDSTLLQANNISLKGGNKLYQLQMKTRFGRESLADSARVKIFIK